VQGKERSFKRRLPQHNKSTHPNNEVPPQDAQLQGVVSMASTHQHKPKQEVLPKDAQLQRELVNHPQELNENACEIT
jgi:hypothetical protein